MPDIDMASKFAMLSSQMVRAPSHFPIRYAITPGAAPVEIIMSGRSRRTIQQTSKIIFSKSQRLQRVASVIL